MAVDEVAVLRAAGLESAAKVIEAARAGQVAAQPTPPQVLAPAAPEPAAAAPAAPAEAEPLPPGILSEEELDGMSMADANKRYKQVADSADYHAGRR